MLESIAGEAPIMANRVLACIRKIYNRGISVDLVEGSPCVKIMAPGEEQRRDRALSDEELKKIWAALEAENSPVADTYKLRLLTVQRGGEVLSMRWADSRQRSPEHIRKPRVRKCHTGRSACAGVS